MIIMMIIIILLLLLLILLLCLFWLSPQDVLDRCYFCGPLSFGSSPRIKEFQRYLRRICAVPSRTVFFRWLGDILSRPFVLKCFLRSLAIAPNDPITTGTTVACFSHSLSISIFRPWYLLIFSSSFSSILPFPGIATSIIHTRFFSTTVMSGMLCARCMSVCILKSQTILTSSCCRTLSTLYFHHLSAVGRLYFLQRFQCSIDATLSCRSL